MICWPYFADQQVNRRFVSHVWKVGLDMKDTCDRVRETSTRVGIWGAISVTSKMTPKSPKTMLQRRWHRRWQNSICDFEVPCLAPLERDAEGCKIAVDGSCASQRLSQRLYSISKSIKIQRFKGKKTYLESLPLKP